MKWLPWIVFAVFGYYLVGNNFNAKLGIIDDHEIAMFLGNDGRVKVSEVPKTLIDQTEVGQWGNYLRYRPSYYLLRVVETSLWGDNARLWYVSRYLIIVVSMWIGFKILLTYFPKIISYLFVFYVMTMPFWPDLLTRLGPSEIYAVPALLLFVYGMIKNKIWMIALGYAVCVGSKENFLILFPILLGWSGYKAYTKQFTKKEIITAVLLTLYTILILGAILVATAKAGTDIYGAQISYQYRITKFVWDIPNIIVNRHMTPTLLLLLAGIATMAWKFKSSLIKGHVVIMLVILAVISSQYIFYINQLPSNTRYDFPALMLFPILDLVAVSMLIKYFSKHKYNQVIKIMLYLTMMIIFSLYIVRRGYTLIHLQSAKNIVQTTSFETVLQKAVTTIYNDKNSTIIFVSERIIDFEPIVSAARFLNSKQISNEFELYYKPTMIMVDKMELDDRLNQVMKIGMGEDKIFERFSAYNPNHKPCYSITFGSALPLPDCPEIARF